QRGRAPSLRGGERQSGLADRHSVRPPRDSGARLQPARALLELHQPVARWPLDAARHRELPDRRRLRSARERGAVPRYLARQLPHGGGARRARLARLAVRVRDPPPAAGHRGARDAARDPESRAGGASQGPPPPQPTAASPARRARASGCTARTTLPWTRDGRAGSSTRGTYRTSPWWTPWCAPASSLRNSP